MSAYQVRCILCGVQHDAADSDVEQVQAAKNNQIYMCAPCQAKVRYESDQKYN